MYMSVPRYSKEQFLASKEKPKVNLAETVLPLKNKLSSEEYSKLWQELLHSGRDLDQLYESCRSGTYQFKEDYENIKKSERLNEALKEIYYNALAHKKKFEEERDTYFKNDKDLAEMKKTFIEESQLLALSNSKYIEYNQRFTQKREEFICHMLTNVSEVDEQNTKLKSEKERISRELGECRRTIYDLREELKLMEKKNNDEAETCRALEIKRDQLKKEAEWMTRQNTKLQESNARFERELSSMNEKFQNLLDIKKDQDICNKELEKKNKDLITKCQQLDHLVEGMREELSDLQQTTKQQKEEWNEEKRKMSTEVAEAKRKAEQARINNYNTIMKNQQLRERLKTVTNKVDQVTKDKLVSVLNEHRVKKTNLELSTHQLELINEILELKSDFFRDQDRIKKGAKLNRRLEKNVQFLERKIQLLKEDPASVDPLEGVQELREKTRTKYAAQKQFPLPSSMRQSCSSIITKIT